MKINLSYFGLVSTANERRDFMLMLKYALEANGHDVMLSFNTFEGGRFNIVFGTHNLTHDSMLWFKQQTSPYAIINTETITDDMLNYNPNKGAGDFLGTWIPLLHSAKFIWDTIPQNLIKYGQYGLSAHFLRWGYVPKMEEIRHDKPKSLDYYYFGTMTDYSQKAIDDLDKVGFKGTVHTGVPYFVRNTYIERAKVCLNLIKNPRFTHINNFRICYLANNGVYTLSEILHDTDDPADYLQYTNCSNRISLTQSMQRYIDDPASGMELAGERYNLFRRIEAKHILEVLIEKSV